MRSLPSLLLLAALAPAGAARNQTLQEELARDVVLRALVDELERNLADLRLEGLARPYFIEYALLDARGAYVSAELGCVTGRNQRRSRSLRVDVRVGSYELDNTNFGQSYGGYWGAVLGAAPVPVEDDYGAIRQAVWWLTDRDYKHVAETFVKKKAFMQSKLIRDKPPDFSRAAPAVYLERRLRPAFEPQWLESLAVTLSRVFREYPQIKDSAVYALARGQNRYLVNSEGTRIRTSELLFSVSANARVQAEDGMELSDSFSAYARGRDRLPPLEELARRCRAMIARLIAASRAPLLDEPYSGPVLLEAEPAARAFSTAFSNRFPGGQPSVGSGRNADDFANKLNQRILPRFVRVVDDPTRQTVAGQTVLGHYLYDDQGVKAQPVTLVERGRLKAQLMSRNPSKEFAQSNGHGRGFFNPSAAVGCLILSASPAASAQQLKRKLLAACQDQGLEYGLRVARLGGYGSQPLVVYKVYPDGGQEPVRGVQIAEIDLRAFKHLLAAGRKPYVLNSGMRPAGATVVVPALLFEELEVAGIDRDFDKPPILPNPLARAQE